jgi:hypothetical protein
LSPGFNCTTNRNRLLVDVITTVPFDAIVLAALRLPEGFTSRYVALLGLLKLGRMYRVGVMFRNMSYNLNLGLLALTLLRNFTVSQLQHDEYVVRLLKLDACPSVRCAAAAPHPDVCMHTCVYSLLLLIASAGAFCWSNRNFMVSSAAAR